MCFVAEHLQKAGVHFHLNVLLAARLKTTETHLGFFFDCPNKWFKFCGRRTLRRREERQHVICAMEKNKIVCCGYEGSSCWKTVWQLKRSIRAQRGTYISSTCINTGHILQGLRPGNMLKNIYFSHTGSPPVKEAMLLLHLVFPPLFPWQSCTVLLSPERRRRENEKTEMGAVKCGGMKCDNKRRRRAARQFNLK